MGFMDKLKQKATEYDLQGKADKLAEGIEKTSKQAAEKAGELAHENRAKVSSGLDKAGAKFDAQTDGKYTDKVAKAKDLASKAVDKVADQRPVAGAPGTTAGTPGVTPQDAPPAAAPTPDFAKRTPPAPTSPSTPSAPTAPPAHGTGASGATPPPGPQDPSI